MLVARCVRTPFRRQIPSSPSCYSYEAAAVDRYLVIRSFFKQQVRALNTKNIPGPPPQKFAFAPPIRLLQTYRNPQCRLFHGSCQRQEGKRFTGESKERKEPVTGRGKVVETNTARDEHSSYRHLENYSRFFRRLAMSLPPIPRQRPTRDDLLNVATNFWQRLRIRFKWITIKSFRKFNADEISAFVSWFVVSQTAWILIGT